LIFTTVIGPAGQALSATGSINWDYSPFLPRAQSNGSCQKMDSLTPAPAFTHSTTKRAGFFISVKIIPLLNYPFAKIPSSKPSIDPNKKVNCSQKSEVNNRAEAPALAHARILKPEF
jgi:hypothetical protein